MGARDGAVEVSTAELGKRIGRSQQAVSNHLQELEEGGYLERLRTDGRMGVHLTARGLEALSTIYTTLRGVLEEQPPAYELRGYLFSGLGEGAYYVSLRGYRRQFVANLGFDPFPGTLNVRLASEADRRLRHALRQQPGILIAGYEDEQRTYGWVRCLPAIINDSQHAAVLNAFERTHYDDTVIEAIAPLNVREELQLRDGDPVLLRIYPTKDAAKTSP
jgi:riboflavin kinase